MFDIKALFRGKLIALAVAFLLLLFFPILATAQVEKGKVMVWVWTSAPDKEHFQLEFELAMLIKGKKARGTFTFHNLINGEWDESDGNIMPFRGTVKNNIVKIEFDPKDARNEMEYEFDTIFYKKPKGRLSSTAILKIGKGKLEWTQVRGVIPVGRTRNPRRLVLKRAN